MAAGGGGEVGWGGGASRCKQPPLSSSLWGSGRKVATDYGHILPRPRPGPGQRAAMRRLEWAWRGGVGRGGVRWGRVEWFVVGCGGVGLGGVGWGLGGMGWVGAGRRATDQTIQTAVRNYAQFYNA